MLWMPNVLQLKVYKANEILQKHIGKIQKISHKQHAEDIALMLYSMIIILSSF